MEKKPQRFDIPEDEVIDKPLIDKDNDPVVEESYEEGGMSVDKIMEDRLKCNEEITYDIVNDPSNLLDINIKKGSPLQKVIEDPTENDILYNSIKDEEPTITVLNNIMSEIAEELAYLKNWRKENFNYKEDMSEISFKRVRMLKELVSSLTEKEKIKNSKTDGKIDFYGDGFKNVFKYFLQIVQDTFKKVNIPTQFNDIFFTQLAKDMDGFEKKAEKIYSGKNKT